MSREDQLKIEVRCRACGRQFPIDVLLVSGDPSRCPFCGTVLNPHYGALLASSLAQLQAAGNALVKAIGNVDAYGASFELIPSSIVSPIADALGARTAP